MNLLIITIILSLLLTGIRSDLIKSDQNENDSERRVGCTGQLGYVTDVLIEVTDTEMKVSYKPPSGYEICGLDYEVKYYQTYYWFAEYQQTINKNLNQSYNYWEGRALCKLIDLAITPIYNGVSGGTYYSNQLTDKFAPHVDIGPIRNLRTIVKDILHIKWWAPIDYETCALYFIDISDIYTGQILNSGVVNAFEWKYDYAAENNYCRDVEVTVKPYFQDVFGEIVSVTTRLGVSPSGSCKIG